MGYGMCMGFMRGILRQSHIFFITFDGALSNFGLPKSTNRLRMLRKYFWFLVLVASVAFNVTYLLHLDWSAP